MNEQDSESHEDPIVAIENRISGIANNVEWLFDDDGKAQKINAQREIIPDIMEVARSFIHPQKESKLERDLKNSVKLLYGILFMPAVLKTMRILHEGGTFEDAKVALDEINKDGDGEGVMTVALNDYIVHYSKRGPDFFRFCHEGNTDVLESSEPALKQVEGENAEYERLAQLST